MSTAKHCDIGELSYHSSGPQWGAESEQLNVTVLSWERGRGLEAQVNQDLDVVFIVLEGEGEAIVEDDKIALRPGVVLPIAKGLRRAVTSTSERLTYVSVHRRRPGLMPTLGKK